MDVNAFFTQYVQERRMQDLPGYVREVLPHLVRYTARAPGQEGMVCYTALQSGKELAQIAEQVAWFREAGQDFEWKVYESDTPASLKALLEAQGFVADEEEAFMVFDLHAPHTGDAGSPRGAGSHRRIVRVHDEAGLRDVVAIQAAVWRDTEFDWLLPRLQHQLQYESEQLSVYCAYVDEQPVGCGWTGFPPGSRIPELHGGSVLAAYRGQGIYSDLYRIRFDEARQRGYRFITVDAAAMSRPILERIGFELICRTWPLRLKF